MDRRKSLKMTAVAAAGLAMAATAQEKQDDVMMEGGWQYKELGYEKHIPVVDVTRDGDVAAIRVNVLKHPQTAEHHISTFKIYTAERIEITRCDLNPLTSVPEATFFLKVPEGTDLIATTDCNIHGLWMKKFKA